MVQLSDNLYVCYTMRSLFATAIFLLSMSALCAQMSPLGLWETTDDETGEVKSRVKIYEESGLLYGQVTEILTDRKDALCDLCKGERYNQPVLGMVIIEGLKKDGDRYRGGKILDPEKGAEYKLVAWLDDDPDVLNIRGRHWTGLYRTQQWRRVD